ncbi:hypothetical protein CBR_g57529 [Chara braunii]|uniref:Glycosyltransferase 2-like domain-containing protein n=1 Tax=Chara braunii TaxID=69332 RepID=A0A388ME60_CHABU|nr:hypothetical protein CBR_g57529 [Chara braunii]|eukprot:GBG92850.1 hypothetical protein CBR_g57529 [Chara braunii]
MWAVLLSKAIHRLRRAFLHRYKVARSAGELLPVFEHRHHKPDATDSWDGPQRPPPPPPPPSSQRRPRPCLLGPRRHWILVIATFCLSIAASSVYLLWKLAVFASMHKSASSFSQLFFAVEVSFFLAQFVSLAEFSRPVVTRKRLTLGPSGPFPRVAILITSCNEDPDVIQDTVVAALAQNYPPDAYTVWVLDDGGDDQLQDYITSLAQETGRQLRYLRRPKPKGVPHFFKAGNLNYALRGIQDEFVSVIDADMIVSPDFLTSMLPHFSSPKIAFVQAPQAYYNISAGDPLSGSGMYFYDIMMPHRDAWGCAQCVGTGVVFRRSCLTEIGLFVTGAVTEDIGTSLQLHCRGYDSVYLTQPLQVGLIPWTMDRCIKQQQRWCLGELQVVWQRGLLWVRAVGFGIQRRIIYFQAVAHSFLAFPVVTLLVLAQLLCFVDPYLLPRGCTEKEYRMYITLLVPHLVASKLLAQVVHLRIAGFLTRQQVRIRGEQAWWWLAPYKCMAVLRAFVPWIPRTFEATGSRDEPAGAAAATGRLSTLVGLWNNACQVGFHLTYVVVALVGIAWRIYRLEHSNCHDLMKSGLSMLFLLFTAQQMSEPIFFALWPPAYPTEDDRRSLLKYHPDGVPVFQKELGVPPTDWRVLYLEILPTIQAALWFYLLFVAWHPEYTPDYCEVGFFDDRGFSRI